MELEVELDGDEGRATQAAIRASLVASGSARVDVEGLPVTIAEWRHMARTVARQLDRGVRTFASLDRTEVHAILTDWPRDEQEAAAHQETLRAAAQTAWHRD